MSIQVRGVAVTEGITSSYREPVDVTLPDREAGDTLLVFYVGESFESSWTPEWEQSEARGTSDRQSGAVFTRQALGDASDAFYVEVAGPGAGYTIIAVATVGRVYLDPNGWYAQTATPSGSVLAAETFGADYSPNPANRVLHFLSAENPTGGEMPAAPGTLLGSGRGGPDDGAVAGLWLATPTETTGNLHLPERTASFWMTCRVYQAVVTYSAPQTTQIARLEDGSGGAMWDTFNARRVVVDNETSAYREHPTGSLLISMQEDARDGDANYTIPGSSGWTTNAFRVKTDYTAGGSLFSGPQPPFHTINQAIHGFYPIPLAREEVVDTEAGHVYWNPYFLEGSDIPTGVLGWEWEDGNVDLRRETALGSVVLSCGVAVDPEDTSAHPHTHPVIVGAMFVQSAGVEWDTSSGHATVVDWTPLTANGLAEYEPITSDENPTAIQVDLLGYLDDDGRAVVFSKAAIHQNGATVSPIAPAVPGYISVGSGDGPLDYGPVASLLGSGYFSVEWTFVTPTYRWITSFEEIVDEVTKPRLRHLNIAPDRRGENWRGTSLRRISSYQ